MSLIRRVARPMLAAMFVTGGVDALRDPGPKGPAAEEVASTVAARLPGVPEQDTELLVRLTGGVQLGAGLLLTLGRVPRLSALALAASLVPTTAAGHRFWEYHDAAQRRQQQIHFLKNVSMLGGLLLAAVDTEGRPGLGWRTRHAAEHAGTAVRRGRRGSRLAAKAARAKLAA
ncbi:MAG: DoxX family membrane protein [Actinobacteria bacterium]|nr:DoxX family membrane protein [Actinomycetota bacterium]